MSGSSLINLNEVKTSRSRERESYPLILQASNSKNTSNIFEDLQSYEERIEKNYKDLVDKLDLNEQYESECSDETDLLKESVQDLIDSECINVTELNDGVEVIRNPILNQSNIDKILENYQNIFDVIVKLISKSVSGFLPNRVAYLVKMMGNNFVSNNINSFLDEFFLLRHHLFFIFTGIARTGNDTRLIENYNLSDFTNNAFDKLIPPQDKFDPILQMSSQFKNVLKVMSIDKEEILQMVVDTKLSPFSFLAFLALESNLHKIYNDLNKDNNPTTTATCRRKITAFEKQILNPYKESLEKQFILAFELISLKSSKYLIFNRPLSPKLTFLSAPQKLYNVDGVAQKIVFSWKIDNDDQKNYECDATILNSNNPIISDQIMYKISSGDASFSVSLFKDDQSNQELLLSNFSEDDASYGVKENFVTKDINGEFYFNVKNFRNSTYASIQNSYKSNFQLYRHFLYVLTTLLKLRPSSLFPDGINKYLNDTVIDYAYECIKDDWSNKGRENDFELKDMFVPAIRKKFPPEEFEDMKSKSETLRKEYNEMARKIKEPVLRVIAIILNLVVCDAKGIVMPNPNVPYSKKVFPDECIDAELQKAEKSFAELFCKYFNDNVEEANDKIFYIQQYNDLIRNKNTGCALPIAMPKVQLANLHAKVNLDRPDRKTPEKFDPSPKSDSLTTPKNRITRKRNPAANNDNDFGAKKIYKKLKINPKTKLQKEDSETEDDGGDVSKNKNIIEELGNILDLSPDQKKDVISLLSETFSVDFGDMNIDDDIINIFIQNGMDKLDNFEDIPKQMIEFIKLNNIEIIEKYLQSAKLDLLRNTNKIRSQEGYTSDQSTIVQNSLTSLAELGKSSSDTVIYLNHVADLSNDNSTISSVFVDSIIMMSNSNHFVHKNRKYTIPKEFIQDHLLNNNKIVRSKSQYIYDKILTSDQILLHHQEDTLALLVLFDFQEWDKNKDNLVEVTVWNFSKTMLSNRTADDTVRSESLVDNLVTGMLSVFKNSRLRNDFHYKIINKSIWEELNERVTTEIFKDNANSFESMSDNDVINSLIALLCVLIIGFSDNDNEYLINPIFFTLMGDISVCKNVIFLLAHYCIYGQYKNGDIEIEDNDVPDFKVGDDDPDFKVGDEVNFRVNNGGNLQHGTIYSISETSSSIMVKKSRGGSIVAFERKDLTKKTAKRTAVVSP